MAVVLLLHIHSGLVIQQRLVGHQGNIMGAAFNPDGTRIVTASLDKTVRIWKVDGTEPPLILRGHLVAIWSAAFSPDGQRIVTASWCYRPILLMASRSISSMPIARMRGSRRVRDGHRVRERMATHRDAHRARARAPSRIAMAIIWNDVDAPAA